MLCQVCKKAFSSPSATLRHMRENRCTKICSTVSDCHSHDLVQQYFSSHDDGLRYFFMQQWDSSHIIRTSKSVAGKGRWIQFRCKPCIVPALPTYQF